MTPREAADVLAEATTYTGLTSHEANALVVLIYHARARPKVKGRCPSRRTPRTRSP